MQHRISAGGIVLQQDRLLLVHHVREGEFDFWVPPGGGVVGDEGFMQAAEREVFEETNLVVQAERLAYVQELLDGGRYVCKFWVCCRLVSGELDLKNKEAQEDFLQEAGFFSQAEIQTMNVYPAMLKDIFWQDQIEGFAQIRYLGYSK